MPETSNALIASSNWIVGTLTGTLGVALAILAIAGVGFAMLQGRLAVRSGLRVVMGCFILFGAPAIAQGLSSLARTSSLPPPIQINPLPASSKHPSIVNSPTKQSPYELPSVPE